MPIIKTIKCRKISRINNVNEMIEPVENKINNPEWNYPLSNKSDPNSS